MTRLHTFALSVSSIAVFAVQSALMHAQAAPSPPSQGLSIAITLALQKDTVTVRQKPLAVVMVKNIGQNEVCLSSAPRLYRVHIEGKDGEPPETEYQRHLHGDVHPGDGPVLPAGSDVCLRIVPGASHTLTYDLSAYRDLSAPGKYSVYIDMLDEPKGPNGPSVWLRTNTAQFEVLAPTQHP